MNYKCKCKNPNEYSIVEGVGIRCGKCLKWITRFHKSFHRQTKIRKSKKVYNRKRKSREE